MQVVGHSDGVSNQLRYVGRQGHPLRTVTIHCSGSQVYAPQQVMCSFTWCIGSSMPSSNLNTQYKKLVMQLGKTNDAIFS